MIKSDVVKIQKINNFDDNYIESELLKTFKSIIRWAIVDITDSELVISVSYQM